MAPAAIFFESDEAQDLARHTREMLTTFGVTFEERRVEDRVGLRESIEKLRDVNVFVVFDTSAEALSHAVSRVTIKPVLAVPVEGPDLTALEALRASTRGGAAAGSLAIGKAGAINAALMAVAILANSDAELRLKLERFRSEQTAKVLADALE